MSAESGGKNRTDRIIARSDTLRTELEEALLKLEEYANQLSLEAARLRKTTPHPRKNSDD